MWPPAWPSPCGQSRGRSLAASTVWIGTQTAPMVGCFLVEIVPQATHFRAHCPTTFQRRRAVAHRVPTRRTESWGCGRILHAHPPHQGCPPGHCSYSGSDGASPWGVLHPPGSTHKMPAAPSPPLTMTQEVFGRHGASTGATSKHLAALSR